MVVSAVVAACVWVSVVGTRKKRRIAGELELPGADGRGEGHVSSRSSRELYECTYSTCMCVHVSGTSCCSKVYVYTHTCKQTTFPPLPPPPHPLCPSPSFTPPPHTHSPTQLSPPHTLCHSAYSPFTPARAVPAGVAQCCREVGGGGGRDELSLARGSLLADVLQLVHLREGGRGGRG